MRFLFADDLRELAVRRTHFENPRPQLPRYDSYDSAQRLRDQRRLALFISRVASESNPLE